MMIYPARAWTAKYGSITLTLFGKEFPEDGMNEAGLVLMPMALHETEYPHVGKTPRLELRQWKQYVLDSFGSVEANRAVAADFCRVALEVVPASLELPLLGMTFAEMVEQIGDFSCASVAGC